MVGCWRCNDGFAGEEEEEELEMSFSLPSWTDKEREEKFSRSILFSHVHFFSSSVRQLLLGCCAVIFSQRPVVL